MLTILLRWTDDKADFGVLIEQDLKMIYSSSESVLLTLVRETASNFIDCPMLKEGFLNERDNRAS